MYRTYCVLVLLSLYAGMAHSFSWEIVTTAGSSNRLDFYDIDGTLTHTENIMPPMGTIDKIIYDPVHDRVLYADSCCIYSFDIATKKQKCLISQYRMITYLAYDPATELLFWTERFQELHSISLKPGLTNNKVNEEQLIWNKTWIIEMTVDSCGGFFYSSQFLSDYSYSRQFVRSRFDGSEKEVEVEGVYDTNVSFLFDPDQKSHKLYWLEPGTSKTIFKYSDLNGQNITTINKLAPKGCLYSMTASKKFLYLQINNGIWKIPKNPPHDFDIESQLFIENDQNFTGMATKYSIEDIIRRHQNCDALKSLLPSNSVSTEVNLLCVHGTKVSGESRCECAQGYSGERCDVSVCHNYCLHGDCSTSAGGEPKCRCNAGYSGERCEVNECQAYCLNDGVCSLSEDSKPVCQCTGGHEGDRCEVPVFITKCVQTAAMLRDFLNTDVPSVKGVKSTCTATSSTDF